MDTYVLVVVITAAVHPLSHPPRIEMYVNFNLCTVQAREKRHRHRMKFTPILRRRGTRHNILVTFTLKQLLQSSVLNLVMYYYILAHLLACAVNAWLPQDRDLTAFNQSVRFEKLGKRFEPQLPNGITKIRGVNFGGMSSNLTLMSCCHLGTFYSLL